MSKHEGTTIARNSAASSIREPDTHIRECLPFCGIDPWPHERMKKHAANKKLNRVFGDLASKSQMQIKRLEDLLQKDDIPNYMRKKYNKSLQYWKTEPEKYTVVLEDIIV